MANYSKTLEDYFRIPVLVKAVTEVSPKSQLKLEQSLYYKSYAIPVDQQYTRNQANPHTEILLSRGEPCVQKLYFTPEDFNNDWPQLEVIYKVKYAIGIIDQEADQKQLEDSLVRIQNENGVKLIGIIDMGSTLYEHLIKKENLIKYPEIAANQFRHFIEPWLYSCLSFIESDICSTIFEVKKQDESNRTIVFNRLQEKLDAKVTKRRKKYRCSKLCGDYYLILQLYKEAYAYYNEAEEQLRKLDDYIWVLSALQGKLACAVVSQGFSHSNVQEYIDSLISQTFAVAKKIKVGHFQCQNYLKISRMYFDQPEKFDEMIRSFLNTYGKQMTEDEKFLCYTVLGKLYEKVGMRRKSNLHYYLASQIHIKKKPEISELLLLEIQKSDILKQWPFLYKNVLQLIISESSLRRKTNEHYLELLSKCGNDLDEREIQTTLAQLNFNNHQILELIKIDFINLKEFSVQESKVKPKANRIGQREAKKKTGPGFFMSWKKDQNFLFQEDEAIVFKGTLLNSILFPIRVKITFSVSCASDASEVLSRPEFFCYVEPLTLHKFQENVRIKCSSQEIWSIDTVQLYLWNFKATVPLPQPIKFQIYEKQPSIDLIVQEQIHCEESSHLSIDASVKVSSTLVPFCLIKLGVAVYYTVDVGFQENQIVLRKEDNFMGIDFNNVRNLVITESDFQEMDVMCEEGVLFVAMKKLKAHRKFIGRIQFNLQYIRSPTTKYQTTKHYTSKCLFYTSFKCEVEQITTPTIQQIYGNILASMKIIEKYYTVKLKLTKLNNSIKASSFRIYHDKNQYAFADDNTLSISFLREKEKEKKEVRECVQWENIFQKRDKGVLEVVIPPHDLMKKCDREVRITIKQISGSKQRRKLLQYQITSQIESNMSHELTLTPQQLEIDRMYALSGKSKVQALASTFISNKVTIMFSAKCNNSYKLGLLFKDGWVYWHDPLIGH